MDGKNRDLESGSKLSKEVNDKGLGVELGSFQLGDMRLSLFTLSLASRKCQVVFKLLHCCMKLHG